jgi:importin-5
MISATFAQLVDCIGTESDASFLSSLYTCLHRSLIVVGGPSILPLEFYGGVIEATKLQLQTLADRRKHRANLSMTDPQEDQEELTLIQEMEDFALEDMSKLLRYFDPNHPLLVAVSSVKDLRLSHSENDSDNEE